MTPEPTDPPGGPPGQGSVVTLRFTALPEHVRTARLVATAVARRIGLLDEQLDAVRLAVGEACARAVQRAESAADSAAHGAEPDAGARGLVTLHLAHHPVGGERVHLEAVVLDGAGDDGVETEDVAMLLMEGLADQVLVAAGPGGPGGRTTLVWTGLERLG